MRKTFILLTGLLLACAMVMNSFAAETEKKTPAPAQKVEKAKPDITMSGDAQLRLRVHYVKSTDSAGKDKPATGDYTNNYAWNFKLKAKVNENLCFGMRLSNPAGYATDKVSDNLTKASANFKILSIPEMYFKWKVPVFSISFGIIPVMANTVLNLAYTEQHNYMANKDCCEAGITSWKVYMNNSQTGLDFGFLFLNDKATSVGFNFITAIAEDAGKDYVANALKNDKLRFVWSIPVSILEKKLSFLPVLHMMTNKYRSADKEDANHTLCGGLNIGIKPIKQFGLNLGYAIGGFNDDAVAHEDSVSAPLGMLTNVAVTVKPGFGTASVGFNFGLTKDREADPVINHRLIHFDMKYAMPIKSLILLPRVRIWTFGNSEDDTSELRVRPELFFLAKF